jgi:NAD(P)-dependent dehydrogenase (short-subunit alcohol dehydrogenase family)
LKNVAERESLRVTVVRMDVTSDDSVSAAFVEAVRRCGPIDVLVNNAGVGYAAAIEDLSMAEFREAIDTNYLGAVRCVKAVLPSMRERRSGCIINVTSVAGRIASPAQAAYCSSKFALEAFSEVLAQEAAIFGIRVAIVEPGVIATPIFDKSHERKESAYPGARRLNAFFTAALSTIQVPPSVVGRKVLEIIESDTRVLRHPAGPDARPLLERRLSMSDEQWIASGAIVDDEVWAAGIQQAIGIDMRQYLGKTPRGMVASSDVEKV